MEAGPLLGPRWRPLLALLLCAAAAPRGARGASKEIVCEPITVPMCKGIGYNLTYMPNQFNHDTQEEVGLEVHQFWPLVRIRCSPDLLFFLCSMYTPICLPDYRQPLPPCRAVCERAKRGCSPLMSQYGFEWPERMGCERLPRLGDDTRLCMDQNSSAETTTTLAPPGFPNKPTPKGRTRPPGGGGGPGGGPNNNNAAPQPQCDNRDCRCRDPLVAVRRESHPLYGRVTTGPLANCALPCHQPYFSADERAFTAFWVGLWSVLCFVSTLTTVLTFLIDMERFQYPERPIIFLSACYLFVSLGYIIRLVAGHETVACGGHGGSGAGGTEQPLHILYDTTGPALCTLVFLLVYFFGMASSIWWVVLSFTWFLAAGMKWGQEAIAGYSQYFHLAAWLVPSVKSIVVLAMSSVDGDPVAGICYVGNQSLRNLRGFVLAPLVVYLFTGCLFLLAGFVSLFRIRSIIKQGGTMKTDKLERLMIRIGLFTVLYTVPATVVLACLVYEQHYRPGWERQLACGQCGGGGAEQRAGGPDYAVFMLKYFMCLVVGITSGVWIWSGKTLESWRRFAARCRPACWPWKGGGGGGGGAGGGASASGGGGGGRLGAAAAPGSMYSSEASTALTGHTGAPQGIYHKAAPPSHI